MKKIYYIGRDEFSDIILHDDTNVISRTHAILKVGKRGKITISDQSKNGTYVNGIRIASGVDVPISRTDIISFAHLAELDWSLIPNTAKRAQTIVLSIIGGLITIGALGWYILTSIQDKRPDPIGNNAIEIHSDSLKTDTSCLKSTNPLVEENTTVVNDAPKVNATNISKPKTVKKNQEVTAEVDNKKTPKDTSKTKDSNISKSEPAEMNQEADVEAENPQATVDTVKVKKNINAIF